MSPSRIVIAVACAVVVGWRDVSVAADQFPIAAVQPGAASAMEYVPDLGQSLWMKQDGTWSCDSRNGTWTDMQPNDGDLEHGDPRSHAWEGVTVFVPNRKMLVSAGGNRPTPDRKERVGRTNVYDVPANAWKKVAEGDGVPVGSDAWSPFVFDSTADVCLLHDRDGRFWAFDIDRAKWSNFTAKGPPLPGRIRPMSFHDPQRNVWVIERGGQVWVCRHRAVKK